MPFKSLLGITLLVFAVLPGFAAESKHSQVNGTLIVEKTSDKKNIRMLRGSSGPLPLHDKSQRALHDKVAGQFAPEFGVTNPARQLKLKNQRQQDNRTNIRYQQTHQNLPVIGAELVANLNSQQQLSSMSGEISPVPNAFDINPTINSHAATITAINAVSKWYQIERDRLTTDTPQLSIYDPSILVNTASSTQLVWKIEVSPTYLAPINVLVLVDARHGGIVLHFNQVDAVLDRATYTAANTMDLPGTLICDESDPTCVAGDQDAQDAHTNAANVYDFYLLNHGRDSIDGNGMTIVSTTHFGSAGFQNAFWIETNPITGQPLNQIAYGDGFASADDVVGHELTHGVTSFTSDLLYYSESGAINESLSDIWGEFIDLTNNIGTDTPAVRWRIGEDLPTGAVRDMANPTTAPFRDPDRMTSNLFYIGADDNGGVHRNSGVNNKAAYLMVDGTANETGGQFNGRTITGIGITKTAKIYYEAQTNLLTTGSDYLDLYNALNQACANLVGTSGITSNDCVQVQLALDAVEMNMQPNVSYAPTAALCINGANRVDLFFDDFEANNLNNWTFINDDNGSTKWATGNSNINSTTGAITIEAAGHDTTFETTQVRNISSIAYRVPIYVPRSTQTYIHFDQAFYFESESGNNYDAGLIEYSTDGGSTWTDAGNMIAAGRGYTGTITSSFEGFSNKNAFVGYSNGFNSTRLNISSLAGRHVQFRFRSYADETVESGPWTIDNFRVFMCTNNPPPIPNAGSDQTAKIAQLVQLSGSANDPLGENVTVRWAQVSGDQIFLSNPNILNPTFSFPSLNGRIELRLTVTDASGQSESDTVMIVGSGEESGGCTLNPNARFDPIWMLLLIGFSLLHLRRRKQH